MINKLLNVINHYCFCITKTLNFKRGFLVGVIKPGIKHKHSGGFPNLW